MYQKIVCAHCGVTIVQISGDGQAVDGWASCECGYETKISKAICTNECRLVQGRQLDPSSHNYNRESSRAI